jgi:hypothetical protein
MLIGGLALAAWTRPPMNMAFAVKGVPGMRSEIHDSASMLFRHVDIDLPPIRCSRGGGTSNYQSVARSTSARAKATDHPARLFLRFVTDRSNGGNARHVCRG